MTSRAERRAETTDIHPGHGYSVTDGVIVTGRLRHYPGAHYPNDP